MTLAGGRACDGALPGDKLIRMYLEVAQDVETLVNSGPGIISQPFGYKEPLTSRLRKGLLLAIVGVFAVLLVMVMAIAILDAILHLPFLLIALAWVSWRSRRKAATTESVEEQPITWDDSSNISQSFERNEALGRMYETRSRRRDVTPS